MADVQKNNLDITLVLERDTKWKVEKFWESEQEILKPNKKLQKWLPVFCDWA